MSLPPITVRRILREVSQLAKDPPEGVKLSKESISGAGDDGDLGDIRSWVAGPVDTPFHGGYFKIKMSFGDDYPSAPPKCTFITRIFHPNVNPSTGEICVDTLKKGWEPKISLAHILVVIKCLLIHPNPASALHAEAGKLLVESYADYCSRAKLFTSIHAIPPAGAPVEFASSPTSQKQPSSTAPVPTIPLAVSSASNSFSSSATVNASRGLKGAGIATTDGAQNQSLEDGQQSSGRVNGSEDSKTTVKKPVEAAKPVAAGKKRGLKRL